jgi:hypothetical protein
MNSAEICRANGWKVGDVLVGDECGTTACIQITAIGIECVLACENDGGDLGYEREWSLEDRDWKKVEVD